MKKYLLLVIVLFSCSKPEAPLVDSTSDTEEMVKELKQLYQEGNPNLYYHWNAQLASLLRQQIDVAPKQSKINVWLQYCQQLLFAGQVDECIKQIEVFISSRDLSYAVLVNEGSLPIIELLALAYLRKGELDNCRDNHNEFSCILPLQEEAFHQSKLGSEKAIEIYTLILDKFPSNQNKWMLNLAYMTLGLYPDNVPKSYLLNYPNWDKELQEFPPFKESAASLGLAENGLSGGACADDFDGDGRIDLFMTSYGMQDQCRLFRNTGSGFEDVTEKSGLKGIVSGLNCIHADYDNDGDQDILILRGAWLDAGGNHPNSLLQNDGKGNFKDVTRSAGVLSYRPTQTAAWADVNGDGYLDLFIGNESKGDIYHPCELFINQQNGTFKEEALNLGLGQIKGYVKGVSFGDIDNDKWPDLFVSIMGGKNHLFKNEKGRFVDISKTAGVESPIFSFPCWFWDVNNDGFDDIMVNSYDPRSLNEVSGIFINELLGESIKADVSKLYINRGNNTFIESAKPFGVNISSFAMGSNFGDLDNDGWLDFYLGTGAPQMSALIPNRMFKNLGGQSFAEVTSAGRFGHIQKGHGVSFADFDQDGDQDIYAVLGGAYEGDQFQNVYFENPIQKHNWIILELEGVSTNKKAIGTKLKVNLKNGRSIYSTINTGGSFGSNSLQAEIGLGDADVIESVEVFWQNSPNQIIRGLSPNKKYKIEEGKQSAEELSYAMLKFDYNAEHNHTHHNH